MFPQQEVVDCPALPMQGRLGSLCWLGRMECKHHRLCELHNLVCRQLDLFLIYTFYNSELINITAVPTASEPDTKKLEPKEENPLNATRPPCVDVA